MTTHKFRFWIASEKRMIHSIGFCFESETQIRIWYRKKNSDDENVICNESFAMHDVSFSESLGLVNGKGEQLYQGDVISLQTGVAGEELLFCTESGRSPEGRIIWNKKTCMFDFVSVNVIQKRDILFDRIQDANIIGNIYQNPELGII